MKKKMYTIVVSLMMTTAISLTALAGWQHDEIGRWWQNDDNSYPAGRWQWLDDNGDRIAECYFFDSNGYVLTSTTTPDGYTVNKSGEWVLDGVIQTKVDSEVNGGGQSSDKLALKPDVFQYFGKSMAEIRAEFGVPQFENSMGGNNEFELFRQYQYSDPSGFPDRFFFRIATGKCIMLDTEIRYLWEVPETGLTVEDFLQKAGAQNPRFEAMGDAAIYYVFDIDNYIVTVMPEEDFTVRPTTLVEIEIK